MQTLRLAMAPVDDEHDVALGRTAVRPSQPSLPALRPEPPARLGPYVLDRLLGRGGMASVYLAREATTGQAVALKVMDPELKEIDPTFVDRFLHEARANSQLRHANIVELSSFGEEGGWHYLATEYVDCGTVGKLLRTLGHAPAQLVHELLVQLLRGLVHSHERGLVHRDLKPENLLLSSDGVVKIADFGIARTADQTRLTQTGMLVGTAAYMSPEQARGLPLDGRSDLFSAGVLTYELLTGQAPFHSDNPATTITRLLTGSYEPLFSVKPTVPPALEAVVERMLQLDPAARFASAKAALDALGGSPGPQLVADVLTRPLEAKKELDQQAAVVVFEEARRALERGELQVAALKTHLALELDPANAAAQRQLAELSSKTKLHFGQPQNPRIAELERQRLNDGGTPAHFTQLAQLYRLEGNPLKAAEFLKRYLRLKPNDGYAAGQLAQLIGAGPATAASALGPQTRELIAGIRTGGFKATQRPVTAQQPVVPLPNISVPVDEPGLVGSLGALARRYLPALIALALLVLGARWVMRKTDDLTRESLATSDQLRKNVTVPEPAAVAPPPPAPINYDQEFARALDEAVRLEQRGANEQAILAFEAVIADFPKRPRIEEAAFHRAKLLSLVGRNAAARDAFSNYLERWPAALNAPEALLRRGQAAASNLDDAAAEADLSRFLTLNPAHALVPEAWVWRGEVLARRGDRAAAKLDFEAALARLGNSPLRERAEAGRKGLDAP